MKKYLVEKISSHVQLDEIRKDWEEIHRVDPMANIYNSWLWFKGWAKKANQEWLVVTVRDSKSNSYVAFLPLCFTDNKFDGITFVRRIHFGGHKYSYYSGFLCLPEFEIKAIEQIAYFIQDTLKWDYFELRWVRDTRINSFVKYFPKKNFSVKLVESQVSLVINLPDDYDSFLKENMGKSTRKTTKEKVNQVNNNDQYRISVSDEHSIDEDIEILCGMWNKRWNKIHELEWYRHFMRYFFDNKMLRLTVLWFNDIPIASRSCILDPANKIYNGYMTSYNPEYSKVSPGIVLFAESVKYAIGNKYKFYDLTVGADPYKLSFGPQQIATKNLNISRISLKSIFLIGLLNQVKKVKRMF